MNKVLILFRGLPGAGKTTMARMLCDIYHEADMYFMNDEKYEFDKSQLGLAHEWCQFQTLISITEEIGVIGVSNTFTTEKEMQPYFDMAKDYNYTIFTVVVENRNDNKNIHDAPEDVIERMKNRFQIKL